MTTAPIACFLRVAIPVGSTAVMVDPFDYLPPPNCQPTQLQPGQRLRVPFGSQHKIGVLIDTCDHTDCPAAKLKPALALLDNKPLFDADMLALLRWASHYYHYPLGDVLHNALPKLLRQGDPALVETLPNSHWCLTTKGVLYQDKLKSVKQQTILRLLRENLTGLSETALELEVTQLRPQLLQLEKRGLIKPVDFDQQQPVNPSTLTLHPAQTAAIDTISQHLGQFATLLLDGVTGSGKTEVYLHAIERVLAVGQQALVLVPEINLTPQMIGRFEQRFNVPMVMLHSQLTPKVRLQAWLGASSGHAHIVIGTRSAVWTPMPQLGIIIIDEEHDASYKQQDHFRYSARDVAVMRAKRAQIPIVLGSATPSLDSLYNVQQQRYQHLVLPERAGKAVHPTYQLVDMRKQPRSALPLSQPLHLAIQQQLDNNKQTLLFINRRGYAPVLMCFDCGWLARCVHCDANLTYHDLQQQLRCHHCGAFQARPPACPQCHNSALGLLGQGTERVSDTVQQAFPEARVLRIDSDSTRRKNALATMLTQIHDKAVDILVGTQMLAKGHHFPDVTLVGVLNIDAGLYGVDFRATERVAQLLLQVSGRAGRAGDASQVLIQTYHPEHPLLNILLQQGYSAFAEAALPERQLSGFPPFGYIALLRAEAKTPQTALQFLHTLKSHLPAYEGVAFWGPAAAPMEKRADYYRAQLLLQASERRALHTALQHLRMQIPKTPKVRWSLDVDPGDLF